MRNKHTNIIHIYIYIYIYNKKKTHKQNETRINNKHAQQINKKTKNINKHNNKTHKTNI